MALINYLARVHFADGVLEEALWSELEAKDRRRPLFVAGGEAISDDLIERLFASLPVRSSARMHSHTARRLTAGDVRDVAQTYLDSSCDVIVAVGDAGAIDLAKLARLAVSLADGPRVAFDDGVVRSGASPRHETFPDLLAVPELTGFGAALDAEAPIQLSGGEAFMTRVRELIPRVTICDPTITIGLSREHSAAAAAEAVNQCAEAFLSRGYNPPAEGIAVDGLRRALASWERVLADGADLEARREMMAASLDGALSVQKGLGASHASSAALRTVSEGSVRSGALKRVTLPEVLRLNREAAPAKFKSLNSILGSRSEDVDEGVARIFASMPLPTKLSAYGLSGNQLERAAVMAADDLATGTNPRAMNVGDYLALMQAVH